MCIVLITLSIYHNFRRIRALAHTTLNKDGNTPGTQVQDLLSSTQYWPGLGLLYAHQYEKLGRPIIHSCVLGTLPRFIYSGD